jgi:hypothetical protein
MPSRAIPPNAAHQPPRAKGLQYGTKTLSRGQAACAGWAVFHFTSQTILNHAHDESFAPRERQELSSR